MRSVSIVFFVLLASVSFSQSLQEREDSLSVLLGQLRAAKNDSEKAKANIPFKAYLEETIQQEGAFQHPFSKLTTVGTITSSDNEIRLFNWNIEQDDMTQKYYCYILRYDKRKKAYVMSELIDNSLMLPQKPTEALEADQWYGALYYRIIPVKKGSRVLYTLLGWDGNSSVSTIKLMDVLYFSGSKPRLGMPIFNANGTTHNRLFYEHSKKTTMHLNYEENRKRIIMDHLSPETPSMKGVYAFYVPDLSYDAFIFDKGKWYLKEDVIGVNNGEHEEKITVTVLDPKTGKLVEKKIKNKWEDPSDPNAPAGGSQHQAATPEGEDTQTTKTKKKLKLFNRKPKNVPSSNTGPTKRR